MPHPQSPKKFDGVDSDRAALLMNFELDCNTLLSNKSNREKEKLPKKMITISYASRVNQTFKKGSLLTLTALTLPPHKNSQCKNSSKTLKSTLLNLPLK
jgi:hypothetical protein